MATKAEIWGYVLSNGLTAAQTLMEVHRMLRARAQRGAGGSSGTVSAQQRAHRLTMIRQQNDLILAIAVAVAGSGALD